MKFGLEMNPQGLKGPFLEYLPENRSTSLDGPWPNSGLASAEYWDLNGGHVNVGGVTKHFWIREVYTDAFYAVIEPGSEEIDMPTYGELWEQLGGPGPSAAFTFAYRIGNLDNINAQANYIQASVEFSNAEYETAFSTIAQSIRRMYLGYAVRQEDNDRILQQNGQRQSPNGGGWGTAYVPDGGDTSWANTVWIITGQIGVPESPRIWKNGVEIAPPFTGSSTADWDYLLNSGLPGEEDTTWAEEFNATWGAYDPYPNRYTAQGATSPDNATVDAILTLMEGCYTLGSDTPPTNNDNGLTHMAFYRGAPTPSDIAAITARWNA